jgi:hypothetical protein
MVCENAAGDTPAAANGPPCADITKLENHVVPPPQGSLTIATTTTFGSSGIIGGAPPLPTTTPVFTFPNKGSFTYFCHIHDDMTGVVKVVSH